MDELFQGRGKITKNGSRKRWSGSILESCKINDSEFENLLGLSYWGYTIERFMEFVKSDN